MKYRFSVLAIAASLLMGAAVVSAATEQEVADMRRIQAQFPELQPAAIRPSPISGVYEVGLGTKLSYVSADGRYLIQGDLFDATTEENLTESRRMIARTVALDNVGASSMIVFEPEEATHTITVFTDIDCGYCRKLHRQIDDYNARGITVRYMFFPRSGPDTASWAKAEEVWCAEDRNSALTSAKSGEYVNAADCDSSTIRQHYELGRVFGIQGTPAIIADTGEMIPGYVAPDELLRYLEEE